MPTFAWTVFPLLSFGNILRTYVAKSFYLSVTILCSNSKVSLVLINVHQEKYGKEYL